MLKFSVALPLFVLIFCSSSAQAGLFSTTWHYKMIVEVNTPEGVKTGSAVREITVHKGLKLTPEMLDDVEFRGEAVVVDLGKRGLLFAINEGGLNSSPDYAADVFLNVNAYLNDGQKRILPPDQYPRFVRFRNLQDPKSVEDATNIIPDGPYKQDYSLKGELFGGGVSIKEVAIERTDEPITVGIIKLLPWLPETGELDGSESKRAGSSYPFANLLNSGEFSTELRTNE